MGTKVKAVDILAARDHNQRRAAENGESQRDFYARTAAYWSSLVQQRRVEERQSEALSEKEIKKEGFVLAAAHYSELCSEIAEGENDGKSAATPTSEKGKGRE